VGDAKGREGAPKRLQGMFDGPRGVKLLGAMGFSAKCSHLFDDPRYAGIEHFDLTIWPAYVFCAGF
jgi:hypothetical protein